MCCATYQDSKTLNKSDVEIPLNNRPLIKIQKLDENFIPQHIAYSTQNTRVIFLRPNLSAKGPVKVPNVEEDPKPAKNNRAIVFSANPYEE